MQITGGIFNHTANIQFPKTGQSLKIVQHFLGLNAWDQLSVDIELFGELPDTEFGSHVTVPDFTEAYSYASGTQLQSSNRLVFNTNGQDYPINIDQEVWKWHIP